MALFFYQFTPLYGHNPKNDGLSVKYVLLTDKSAKKGTLSVKFERNLGESPKIKKSVPSRHEF